MPNNTKFKGWTSVLNSVRTPLGFFALLALILDGILLVLAAATKDVSMLAPIILLALLILCVFSIVLIKPLALYHPKDWPARGKITTVVLVFPVEAIQVDLDINQCILEIRYKNGKIKSPGTPNLTFGNGGWAFQLREEVEPSDSIRLELIENSGRKWRINPFTPHEIVARAIQVNPD